MAWLRLPTPMKVGAVSDSAFLVGGNDFLGFPTIPRGVPPFPGQFLKQNGTYLTGPKAMATGGGNLRK